MLWGEGLDALCRDSFKCLGCLSRSSPHILLFRFFNFSKPFLFSMFLSHYSLSPPPSSFDSILSLALILILLFNFCPFSATSVLVSQHSTAAPRPLTYSFHSHHHSESENHLNHCHFTLVPSIVYHPQGFQVMSSTLKLLCFCMSTDEVVPQKNNSAFV